MVFFRRKSGLTLIEMLVVVGIIAVLVSITMGIASRIEDRGKVELTRSTVALVSDALAKFADYGYQYRDSSYYTGHPEEREFYLSLAFPPDCNGFSRDGLSNELKKIMDIERPQIIYGPAEAVGQNPAVREAAEDFTRCSGCMVMYLFLSMVPDCAAILDRIDSSLITDRDYLGQRMSIFIQNGYYPLRRIVDAWGRTLRYDYYEEWLDFFPAGPAPAIRETIKTFPLITSAGPDGKFDTRDDITN